jgi:hypothetical protein
VRYHFLRDNVEKGKIALIHVLTHDLLANIFTKPLDQETLYPLTHRRVVTTLRPGMSGKIPETPGSPETPGKTL